MLRYITFFTLFFLLINNTCLPTMLIPGYEKFEHYDVQPVINPPPPAPGAVHLPLAPPNNAYTDYDEAHIWARISGPGSIPPLQYRMISSVGISLKADPGNVLWNDLIFPADNGEELTLPDVINMAVDRRARGVTIKFTGEWPPTMDQFIRGGYQMPLAKALQSLKTSIPQPNYLFTHAPGAAHPVIATEIVIHFNLLRRTSKNMRDVQTNGYPFPGQNTLKSLINQQRAAAIAAGVPLPIPAGNPDSASIVSYLYTQSS